MLFLTAVSNISVHAQNRKYALFLRPPTGGKSQGRSAFNCASASAVLPKKGKKEKEFFEASNSFFGEEEEEEEDVTATHTTTRY